jgi:putative transposase
MARPERFTPAGVPVHVTQRGNFRALVFTEESDYLLFLRLLKRYSRMYQNRVVGYCLMPNHFHLVVIPGENDGVSPMMRVLTSVYSRLTNEHCGRHGHSFQARFGSASMSEKHYRTAVAYVDLNPVRAGMVVQASEYLWSSAAAHEGLVAGPEFLDREEFARMYTEAEWREILASEQDEAEVEALRTATRLGKLLGSPEFVKQMEREYGRSLVSRKVGRPRKNRAIGAGG